MDANGRARFLNRVIGGKFSGDSVIWGFFLESETKKSAHLPSSFSFWYGGIMSQAD
ncbi:hypothetical protein PGT21_002930 [Puccinia graminis f. sp. tritici]|uniref:Uncharacterized protein n=1 Tax=Puccinia graminis f. sp. tritici TaxID=56615 RepID=A0A5B0Q2B9_PUCGR|nr:hypothetical protein PGT21_002930 [Puccinia graminis f. sp. tritici]